MDKENSSTPATPKKKKFQLDYITSIFLATILFTVAMNLVSGNKEKGLTADLIIGIVCFAGCAVVMFSGIKNVIKARKAQLYAKYEQQRLEAEKAKQENDDSADDE